MNAIDCEIREGAKAFVPFWGFAAFHNGRCVAHCLTREMCSEVIRDFKDTVVDAEVERRD